MLSPTDILNRIAAVAGELNLTNLQPQIASCRELLRHRHGIDVAVFGRFKAGKSSFLNHLTGRDVLPIGVVPLTAVITRLRYGPTERAEIHFLDGTVKTIPLNDIALYVGEHENPDNQKRVALVEVELLELKRFAPLQFVDTPGLGSAFTHNTDVALHWLPNVGAALVAVSSDAPLSERDLALLEELRRHTPRIVLLLTKADLLTAPQREEVLKFVRDQLRPKWNGELAAFFYSIRPGEGDLKTRLQNNLLNPLMQNCAGAAAQIAEHKLSSLLNQTLNYLQIALAAATQAESARDALRRKLAEEQRQFVTFREETQMLTHEWSARALEESLARLLPVQRELQGKVAAGLRSQFDQWRLRLPAYIRTYGGWLQDVLNREISQVSHAQRAMFCEPLGKVRRHLARSLRALQDRLAEHVKSALGLSLSPHEFTLEVREPEAPPVDVSTEFIVPMDALGYVIPMTIFRPLVERNLLRRARYEVEKNLSRLAADWRDRITPAVQELTRQAEQHAQAELDLLEHLLAQTQSNTPQLQNTIAELQAAQTQ